ncbi:hypothetical protein NDU88_004934 [Pleurodeles waltl]|uniref:Uncharacterized protein n=1 Tax=Pleurodeles waltl TaxID=8319 RepID=A0AAV7MWV2_PLEWA|nr:hypothetical protein NDU88_004934 [Pleurodeles waltl]
MVATSSQPNRGQDVSPSKNKRQTVAEIHQSAQSLTVESQAHEISGNSPLQGTKEVPQVVLTVIGQDGWTLQETSAEAPGREDEIWGTYEEVMGEENSPNEEEQGEVGRSDYTINTINASLLAAVKALTWQSHKM